MTSFTPTEGLDEQEVRTRISNTYGESMKYLDHSGLCLSSHKEVLVDGICGMSD